MKYVFGKQDASQIIHHDYYEKGEVKLEINSFTDNPIHDLCKFILTINYSLQRWRISMNQTLV